jgi:hypothetical protein
MLSFLYSPSLLQLLLPSLLLLQLLLLLCLQLAPGPPLPVSFTAALGTSPTVTDDMEGLQCRSVMHLATTTIKRTCPMQTPPRTSAHSQCGS